MADDAKMMNGEFSEDQTVSIGGDEVSEYELKIAELSDEIALLEKEKNQVVYENKSMNDRIRKMKESIESLNTENEGLRGEVEKLVAENKGLQAVAARAAELEGEVARTQHDLISAMSDLQEANGEIVGLRAKLEGLEDGEMEKAIKMDAVLSERDLLLGKVADLEAIVGEKEKEIKGLEGRIEELKLDAREKEELKKKVRDIEGKLLEEERVIRDGGVIGNGAAAAAAGVVEDVGSVAEGREKEGNLLDGWKMGWSVVAVSTVSAVAAMGVVCYLHYARRK